MFHLGLFLIAYREVFGSFSSETFATKPVFITQPYIGAKAFDSRPANNCDSAESNHSIPVGTWQLSLRFVAAGCVPSSSDKADKEESAGFLFTAVLCDQRLKPAHRSAIVINWPLLGQLSKILV